MGKESRQAYREPPNGARHSASVFRTLLTCVLTGSATIYASAGYESRMYFTFAESVTAESSHLS